MLTNVAYWLYVGALVAPPAVVVLGFVALALPRSKGASVATPSISTKQAA